MNHSERARSALRSAVAASIAGAIFAGAHSQTLPPPPVSPVPVTNYEYDAQGNPTRVIQAPGVAGYNFTTNATYDPLSRRKDATDARAGRTAFDYDGLDRLTRITDPRNLVTQYPRNGLGDVSQLVSPDTGTANHTYDAAGNLKTRTDSRGVLATYTYDTLNRLTSVVYSQSGQPNVSYAWTFDQTGAGFSYGIGRLTTVTYPAGTTRYAYDPLGQATSVTQTTGVTLTTSYGYDTGGRINRITYPSGRVLTISYVSGLPSAIQLARDSGSTPQTLISQIQLQPFGGVESWLWHMNAATVAHQRVFDTSGRIVRYPLAAHVRDLTYDAADRITSYTHLDAATGAAVPALNQGFGYDELGRLTSITTASASWSIGYDANGNRTGVTLNGNTSAYTTSATSNRLTSVSNPARSFTHDAAGNTTSDNAAYTATYGLDNRLASLSRSGTNASYSYDSADQRVRKVVNGTTTYFVYDQDGQLLGEYNASGAAVREYVWLSNIPVAVFTPDPAGASNPPIVHFIHVDHLNTPRVVVDRNNALRWRWMAEPFGTTATEENPAGLGAFVLPLRFPGQYFDQESGLHYNWHRDYDATTGRYVQSDPIGLGGGINTYAYVGSNPLSAVDPKGLQGCIPVMTPYGPMCTPVAPPIGAGAAGGSGGSHPGSGDRGAAGFGDGGDGRGSCTLYHIVDCAGEIVYVGITQQDERARESQHQKRVDGKIRMWECVNCKLTFTPIRTYSTKSECKNAETQQIRALRPLFNDAENPDSAMTLYERRREWFNRRCILCQ
jgi:RHS repeat-associated protein